MKPWTGWVIVEKGTGAPAAGLLDHGPTLYRTAALARASLRLDLGVDVETHEVVQVTLRATDTTSEWCGRDCVSPSLCEREGCKWKREQQA